MKKLHLSILFLLPFCISAQEVISAQGTTYSSSTIVLNFTLGETIITTETISSVDLTQGFNQPTLDVSSAGMLTEIEFSVYPNPTSDFIQVKSSDFELYNFRLYSISGALVSAGDFTSQETSIDLSNLERGSYCLSILSIEGGSPINHYQIIKQ